MVDAWSADHDGSAEPVACCGGCAHCCWTIPDVTNGERDILQAAIGHLPEPTQRRIAGDLINAADAVKTGAKRVRCPLLGDDQRCTVYHHRPATCRAWASKDATKCAAGGNIPVPNQTRWAKASLTILGEFFRLGVQRLPLALTRKDHP